MAVTVTGHRFNPVSGPDDGYARLTLLTERLRVVAEFDGDPGSGAPSSAFRTDANGSFSVTITLPALPAGEYRILAENGTDLGPPTATVRGFQVPCVNGAVSTCPEHGSYPVSTSARRPPPAMSVRELRRHPTVQAALAEAFLDSLTGQFLEEQGGWIYQSTDGQNIDIRRVTRSPEWPPNVTRFGYAPYVAGYYIVGVFHTHPFPTNWNMFIPGPSREDALGSRALGVPGIIRESTDGFRDPRFRDLDTFSDANSTLREGDDLVPRGPERRVGGLVGDPCFPR